MHLPNTAHTSKPWRIHELTRDFRLEDVRATARDTRAAIPITASSPRRSGRPAPSRTEQLDSTTSQSGREPGRRPAHDADA